MIAPCSIRPIGDHSIDSRFLVQSIAIIPIIPPAISMMMKSSNEVVD